MKKIKECFKCMKRNEETVNEETVNEETVNEENVNTIKCSPLPVKLKNNFIFDKTSKYVVIVEDCAVLQRMIKKMFIGFGYVPMIVSTSKKILPMIYIFHEEYKNTSHVLLVMLDNNLGNDVIEGCNVCALLSQLDFVRVIGMSSNPIGDKYIRNGAIEFIQKPFNSSQIKKILDKYKLTDI